jgi:hypothetical protein
LCRRKIKTGQIVQFERFEEFVTTPPLEGLGATMPMLIRMCRDDKLALDAIDRAIRRPHDVHLAGADIDNINILSPTPNGTSEQAAIRRLRKDRPDLLEQVKEGALSAHAAMIEAGFRDRSITIPDEPVAASRRLLRNFSGDRLVLLLSEMANHAGFDLVPKSGSTMAND